MSGLAIRRITLREVHLPLREPFRISSGVVEQRRILLAELASADGDVAWSECVAGEAPNYSPETVDTAWLALQQWFAPRLLAAPVRAPSAARDVLLREIRGHRMAAATLEMGVWELAARRAGVPLARLLGGTRSSVPVGISIGIQPDTAALVRRVETARADGYRRIKLKIRPGADVEVVAAARDALGPDMALTVDANSAYGLADSAHLSRLDEFGLRMIEQPLAAGDLVRHAELQRRLRTAICLDESVTGLAAAEDMVTLGSGRIINIKPGRVGGLAECLDIHAFSTARAVPLWCGGMLESGIGRGYNVAVASLPGFTLPGDISPSARYWERDLVRPEWRMEDGMMTVPRTPGIGVDIDHDRIDDLTVRAVTING